MPRLLSKVVQPAIGLAAEAIAHHREKSRSPGPESDRHAAASSSAGASAAASSSSNPPQYDESAERGGPSTYDEKRPKSRSGEKKHGEHDDESSSSDSEAEQDEDDWELDDASEAADPPTYDQTLDGEDIPALTKAVLKSAKAPTGVKLQLPVVLPQRRPRDKKRGFVRAYAPVLNDTGIDQETFLMFLKAFHSSSQSSKYWDVIFISAAIAGFAPSVIAMAVTTAVQIAAGTARELQSRKRSNNFLDEMNAKLFMPRGQIALIMTFKPDMPPPTGRSGPISGVLGALGGLISHQELDMNQSIAKYYADDSVSGMKKSMQSIRLSTGKTKGELAMPEAAPLVYPTLEAVADAVAVAKGKGKEGTEDVELEKKKNSFQRSGKFVSDYFDRRAQARYAGEHPGSALSAPSNPQFLSKLGDPAYQRQHAGGLLGTLTGGVLGGRKAERRDRRAAKRAWKNERRVEMGIPARRQRKSQRPQEGQPGYKPKGIGRLMQQDVLYLTIVNMPTDEELSEAVERMQALQKQK